MSSVIGQAEGVFIFNAVILFFLVIMALAIQYTHNLFSAVILLGIYSLVFAVTFVGLDAVDVAFTEAAVGAGISSILMLCTLALITKKDSFGEKREKDLRLKKMPLIICLATGALLLYSTVDMPIFGDINAPVNQHMAPRFIHDSVNEVGLPNVVTSVLASYRGFDTMGETLVIFIAGVAVFSLIGNIYGRSYEEKTRDVKIYEKDQIFIILVKLLAPLIALFGLYVQFHGDFGPGGGFQAGVIFSAAYIFYALIFGFESLIRVIHPKAIHICMSIGVLLYAGTGLYSLSQGVNFLDYSAIAEGTHGQHYGVFLVELGVGITVASVMLSLFYSFINYQPAYSSFITPKEDNDV